MKQNVLSDDLRHILDHTRDLWEELRGKRIFITGGTGFIGCWLLESFAWANDKLRLGSTATVLTRSPERFKEKAPHLADNPAIHMLLGDVSSFELPDLEFTYAIHGAFKFDPLLEENHPLSTIESDLHGTRRVLEFMVGSGCRRLLLTSSGAVYGNQPAEMANIPDSYRGCPEGDDRYSVYGTAKRNAELMCSQFFYRYGLEAIIARCFTFMGYYLPANANFAAADFIQDALRGGPIRIKGNGRPFRSYMYAADMAIWLWTILFKGQPTRHYNVGSEEALTVFDLAQHVVDVLKPAKKDIRIEQSSTHSLKLQRYVPSTGRAQTELKLRKWVELDEAIRRTARSHSELA